MDVLAFVNLSQLKSQYFSFQKPLINYIFDSSQLISSQKLIKSCKIFKLLHLKKNECRLEKVIITFSSCSIFAGLSQFFLTNKNDDRCCCNFDTVMNSIKILDSLELHAGLSDIYLETLIPKLDLSQIKEIFFDSVFYLKREILEIITPTSLEKFILYYISGAEINPALFVFQKCPKLKILRLSCSDCLNPDIVPVLTKNVLEEMLLIKREKKFEWIEFSYASEVDRDDFLNFMNNYLAFNCKMSLVFETNEIFDAFDQMFAEIQEIRQKELKISEIKIYYRLRLSSYWKERNF